MTEKELEQWCNHLIGKACPKHPNRIIKEGRYGLWCGAKDEMDRWCDGGSPTKEFLASIRKEAV